MLKVAILISGRGSNMQAIIDATKQPGFPARVVLVISNDIEAQGLATARAAGVAVATVNHKQYATRQAFEHEIDLKLKEYSADLVCLAGFMRIVTPWFIDRWRDKLVNIHPSLLPAFPGLDTHKKALAYGVKFAGCTVHFVHAEVDRGPIIIQAAVPVHPGDTEETLSARVLEAEHKIYTEAIRLIGEERVNVFEESVFIANAMAPQGGLINPIDDMALAKPKAAQ